MSDRYNGKWHNSFQSLEEVHRYVIDVGALAISLMDDVAEKFGLKFKAVPREPIPPTPDSEYEFPDPNAFQHVGRFKHGPQIRPAR